MGADEKHAATYHGGEYTPTTGIVRVLFKIGRVTRKSDVGGEQIDAEFNRWLEQVRAEAKAEALLGLASELESDPVKGDTFFTKLIQPSCNAFAVWLLRARANQYKENQS